MGGTRRNFFIHDGVRYDGSKYILRRPQERCSSTTPSVLSHNVSVRSTGTRFSRVYDMPTTEDKNAQSDELVRLSSLESANSSTSSIDGPPSLQ
eukprot:CAMPEP_0198727110 /NCGR_PEP_ID=MMETSP1475-20131203/3943_1 /TAXON_ID= ORGANISM="Unidentified sp., Strain CCMP1999" /NCGR_SAMPLE_ID=MMETSP1475 /ASSEMBLY_ACC=CAM_ASM_001111 /LENGTH=93 /DNA_ID=CAMNT_0044489103 /DNA_START=292 /DNA_END=573 /DNA_ORIENTATION=-